MPLSEPEILQYLMQARQRILAAEKERAMFWNPADLLKTHPIEKE